MNTFSELTIVSSCLHYGKYLNDWARSIVTQTVRPGAVCLFTHGSAQDAIHGHAAISLLSNAGIKATHLHNKPPLDFGVARNAAVRMSSSEWVMHLDCDDTLLPNAVEEFQRLAPHADVIQAGYIRTGTIHSGPSKRARLYTGAVGLKAFDLGSIASGVSPFRRTLWEQTPYREDMLGAWDTALWFGFARLGARFVPTSRPVFGYRQHADSIFNKRRKLNNWTRARTTAQLKALRRNYSGIAIIVPLDGAPASDRARVWARVRAHYAAHHPEWPIFEGKCVAPQWSKGEAVLRGIAQTQADVLIIADSDCMVDPLALKQAVAEVQSGIPWAMPHKQVFRASKQATEEFYLHQDPSDPVVIPPAGALDRVPYEGLLGGGIVVTRRVWYDATGGIPVAFRGWGKEDQAFALIMQTLLGICARVQADLLHLYHTPQIGRHSTPGANMPLLRKLGAAAQRGPDALVLSVSTLRLARGEARQEWRDRLKKHRATTRAPAIPVRASAIPVRKRAP